MSSRGELAVPAAARTLAGIGADGHVVLAAVPERDVLLVHAPAVVPRLLLEHYPDLTQERHHDG